MKDLSGTTAGTRVGASSNISTSASKTSASSCGETAVTARSMSALMTSVKNVASDLDLIARPMSRLPGTWRSALPGEGSFGGMLFSV